MFLTALSISTAPLWPSANFGRPSGLGCLMPKFATGAQSLSTQENKTKTQAFTTALRNLFFPLAILGNVTEVVAASLEILEEGSYHQYESLSANKLRTRSSTAGARLSSLEMR